MKVLIVKDNCPICEGSEKRLREAGLLEEIKVLHISDPEGIKLAKEFKLTMAGSDIIDVEANTKVTVDEFIASSQGR